MELDKLIFDLSDQLSGGFNWVVAAYTLTFTTFVPASGQLADIYGRHFALQFEMFWIVVGSVLCAAAQTWSMLLVGRALQGLGAAGIMSLSRIILSDGADLTETAMGNTMMSLISGVRYDSHAHLSAHSHADHTIVATQLVPSSVATFQKSDGAIFSLCLLVWLFWRWPSSFSPCERISSVAVHRTTPANRDAWAISQASELLTGQA